ncbi:polysaccharide biosynthesis/export family protein [Vampirovibrio sp.]|uniref:polysaccharide biosynthesis/export family protein n=1 Tax=Vampirovibrio sp. TaxID=2717857 RepID=UPI003594283A
MTKKLNGFWFWAGMSLTISLLTMPFTMAANDQPANLSIQDLGGVTLPVSLVRGRVANQSSRYTLGPGDRIGIKIQDLDQFNQSVTIRPDGFATIHPFGEHQLSGTDIQALQTLLTEEFKLYLLEPRIGIDVESMRPAMIYVNGAVQHPGTYQFNRVATSIPTPENSTVQQGIETTISNVLGKAGGVKANADIAHIQIRHTSTGEQQTFNLQDFLTGTGKDIWLLPEDTVMVPEATAPMDAITFRQLSHSTYFRDTFPVIVLGAVKAQGEIQMDPTHNSLNAAIAKAGGFVPGLSKRDAIIIQRPDAKDGFKRWVVNRNQFNMALMPGDVVYIPDSKAAWLERGFRLLGSMTQPYFFGLLGASVIHHY